MNEKIKLFKRHLIEEEKAENTVSKYLRDIKEFYKWHNNSNIVTKYDLLDYKEYLKKSRLKVSSINSKISSLNAYFTYTENETLKVKVLKCQKSLFGSKEKELTKYEFNKLYEIAKNNERLKYLIETIVKTGVRVSEVKYITVESIEVGKAIVDNKGKIRTILIPRKLCKKLKDYCKKQNINTGLIFLTKNKKPLDRKQIWQMMKDLADKAGVPKEKVFPHNLRHLFAREFYKQTHDIVKLASILGHSSIETTRIYTRETEDECRIDIEKLEILRE
ncbi:MAG: tyrosine-type recombinase/integrase [Lachnospiraceae bacterium]|nr:tyrosine-type recombinase/integrase [Lachnospiraceae bacterium]